MKTFNGIGFFQEDTNARSSIRLMCFLTLLFAFYITWLIVTSHLVSNTPITQFEMVVILLLYVAAFAPKVIQKFAEKQLEQLNKP